jgi:hypothetical protein
MRALALSAIPNLRAVPPFKLKTERQMPIGVVTLLIAPGEVLSHVLLVRHAFNSTK